MACTLCRLSTAVLAHPGADAVASLICLQLFPVDLHSVCMTVQMVLLAVSTTHTLSDWQQRQAVQALWSL